MQAPSHAFELTYCTVQGQAEAARRWFLEHIKLENCKILCASGARRATETLEVRAPGTRSTQIF